MSILKYISDEELTRAAKKVGEAIRKSLPDPETCRHEFSPEFQKKIEVLKEQGRRKEQKIKYLKRWIRLLWERKGWCLSLKATAA